VGGWTGGGRRRCLRLRGRSIVFTRQRHRSTVPAITPSSRRHPQRPSHAPFCPLPHATTIAPSSLWKWTGSRPSPGWSSWRRPTEQTLSTRPSCAPVVLIDRFVCVCTAIYRFAQHIAANGHPLANAHDVFKHAAHLARCLRTRMARSLSTASPPPPPHLHQYHITTTPPPPPPPPPTYYSSAKLRLLFCRFRVSCRRFWRESSCLSSTSSLCFSHPTSRPMTSSHSSPLSRRACQARRSRQCATRLRSSLHDAVERACRSGTSGTLRTG
jgi:hypothetical protein